MEVDPHPWRAADRARVCSRIVGGHARVDGRAASSLGAQPLVDPGRRVAIAARRALRPAGHVPAHLRDRDAARRLRRGSAVAAVARAGRVRSVTSSICRRATRSRGSTRACGSCSARTRSRARFRCCTRCARSRPSCRIRAGRAALQFLVLLLAFVPMAIVYGHYEDVLALALAAASRSATCSPGGSSGARCSSPWRSRSSSGRCSRCRSSSSRARRRCGSGRLLRCTVPPAMLFWRVPRRRLQVRELRAAAPARVPALRALGAVGLGVDRVPERRADPIRASWSSRSWSRGSSANRARPGGDHVGARRACCSARFFFEPVAARVLPRARNRVPVARRARPRQSARRDKRHIRGALLLCVPVPPEPGALVGRAYVLSAALLARAGAGG